MVDFDMDSHSEIMGFVEVRCDKNPFLFLNIFHINNLGPNILYCYYLCFGRLISTKMLLETIDTIMMRY